MEEVIDKVSVGFRKSRNYEMWYLPTISQDLFNIVGVNHAFVACPVSLLLFCVYKFDSLKKHCVLFLVDRTETLVKQINDHKNSIAVKNHF